MQTFILKFIFIKMLNSVIFLIIYLLCSNYRILSNVHASLIHQILFYYIGILPLWVAIVRYDECIYKNITQLYYFNIDRFK